MNPYLYAVIVCSAIGCLGYLLITILKAFG